MRGVTGFAYSTRSRHRSAGMATARGVKVGFSASVQFGRVQYPWGSSDPAAAGPLPKTRVVHSDDGVLTLGHP
jgi:hypothetical protein